jgi:4-hydroxythreonine-4-phosphate dehydrogenase
LVGDLTLLRSRARAVGIARERIVRWHGGELPPEGAIPVLTPLPPLAAADRIAGEPTPAGGAAQLAWVETATAWVQSGRAAAIVTGPVNKAMVVASGVDEFRGHTEHLAMLTRAREVIMAFYAEAFTTALVTTHLPLARVARAVTAPAVARACYWLARFVAAHARRRDDRRPIAVCGLNPHAGECGLLGREERHIEDGMMRARARLADDGQRIALAGPLPAEAAFRLAQDGSFAGVVAMYHDQATIPMKLVSFGEAVNVSLGLPIVRTSVDHGTAYDRAGKGTADARGMVAALELADRMTSPRRQRPRKTVSANQPSTSTAPRKTPIVK